MNVAQAMPKASRRPSGGRTDAFRLRVLNNERTSAFFAAVQSSGGCLLVSYTASLVPFLALFSAREVCAARVAMGSGRMRLAKEVDGSRQTCLLWVGIRSRSTPRPSGIVLECSEIRLNYRVSGEKAQEH